MVIVNNKASIAMIHLALLSNLPPFGLYAIRAGFYHSKTDSSLFIFHKRPDTAYLLLYVDDIILTASSTSLLQCIISSLHAEFAMTNLGPLNYFLGISVTRTTSGIFLSQKKYATKILEQAQMLNFNPCRTPVDTKKKLGPEGSPVTDPTLYRSLAGSLQYLTFTRSDLSYAVQQLCLYIHDPREPHLNAMKHVLRYLRETTDLGLQLFRSPTSQLIAYSDADWAGCPAMRRSTSGYCVFLGDNLLTWEITVVILVRDICPRGKGNLPRHDKLQTLIAGCFPWLVLCFCSSWSDDPPFPLVPVFLLVLSVFAMLAACAFRAEKMPSLISCRMAAKVMAGVLDVIEEEDGEWICFLGGSSSSGTKKYQGSNSSDGGNTRDGVKIAGGVIGSGDEIELKELLFVKAGK
ncbi:ribonuclease H-like domain-containing protein [Tanacetum coccineum]